MNPDKQRGKMIKAMACAQTVESREEAQKCIKKWEKAWTKLNRNNTEKSKSDVGNPS